MRGALIWTLALLLAPTTAAQPPAPAGHVLYCSKECLPPDVNDADPQNTPVNVILYAHILDALQRAPLNLIPPDLEREPDANDGFMMPTVKVKEDVLWFDHNAVILFFMPTPMKVEGLNQDGPLAYNMSLSKQGAKLYWYLSPYAVPENNSGSSPLGSVGAMPMVTVTATVETGRHPGYGDVIARGSASTPILVGAPGTDYAYEFEVPLEVLLEDVPGEDGFVVYVTWHQYSSENLEFTQNDWRVRSGARFVPRLILPVENPIRLSESSYIYRSGTHYLVTDITPLFGAYDLNPFALNMTFKGGPMDAGKPQPIYYFPNSKSNIPHTIRIVWALPQATPGDANLRAGTYDFELAVSNLWGTYTLRDTTQLDILQFSSAKTQTPGPDAALVVLAIAALAVLLRRRHN